MAIEILQNIHLNGGITFLENNQDFPSNPSIGTLVLKEDAIYGYIKIGGLETWYPFSHRTNSYIHVQGLASLEWNITHNLNTTDIWIQTRDNDGNIVSASTQIIDSNTVQVKFTMPRKGTSVIVGADNISVPEVKTSLIQIGSNVQLDSSGIAVNGTTIDWQKILEIDTVAQLEGALTYQGVWDASTNTPTLQSGVGTKGYYYKVSVAGSTNIDGTSNWQVGDMIVFNGTTWDGLDGKTTEVSSVAGRVGAVVLTKDDIGGLATVASTGSYNDLSNKPSIPTHMSQLTNDADYMTPATAPKGSESVFGIVKLDGTSIKQSAGVIYATPTSLSNVTTWTSTPYDIGFSVFGKPAVSEVVFRFRACRPYTISPNQGNGQAKALTGATASTTFIIAKNGTQVGTIVFAAGSTTGTITIGETQFVVGDLVTITAPATQDATLSDIDFSILASIL